jgi:hypothetical protein
LDGIDEPLDLVIDPGRVVEGGADVLLEDRTSSSHCIAGVSCIQICRLRSDVCRTWPSESVRIDRFYRRVFESPLESVEDEKFMATVETPSVIPADEMDDMEEVCRMISEAKPVADPASRKRIHERAEQVRQSMLERQGTTNIAVDLIREVRDEE